MCNMYWFRAASFSTVVLKKEPRIRLFVSLFSPIVQATCSISAAIDSVFVMQGLIATTSHNEAIKGCDQQTSGSLLIQTGRMDSASFCSYSQLRGTNGQ